MNDEIRLKLLQRRRFLSGVAMGGAAGAFLSPWKGSAFAATPRFVNDPFSLGVASGDPTPDGFVLWTRLAPNPFDVESGLTDLIEVGVEVAEDLAFTRIVRRQTEIARPDLNHSIHAEIYGLPPARPYFYRFKVGLVTSPVGRVSTAPLLGSNLDRFKFAWHSCSHYEQGFYTAYADMAAQNPDLILGLGDYIYETSWGPQVRRMPIDDAWTLSDYRLIHSVTKTDKDLQAAHAACPWVFIWDDHEVANDYQGDVGKVMAGFTQADFPTRKRNAYQAFFEHLPLRRRSMFTAANRMRIYGQVSYGNLVEFNLLDTRQYRARAACATEGRYEAQSVSRATCTELQDANRSILGAQQERFFNDNMMRGTTKWSVLVQPTLFGTLNQKDNRGDPVAYNDGWGGFEPARQKIIENIRRRNDKASCVVIGGDVHAFFAGEVKMDYFNPASQSVAVEFVGGSVTSKSFSYDRFMAMMPESPHFKFFDDRTNGYGLAEISPTRMDVKLRHTPSTWRRDAGFTNIKHFVVEKGSNRLTEV
jgi:alkaline phosphatase D